MNRLRKYHCVSTLLVLCCLPGYAATVYKSVDKSGVVTFSDTRPTGDVLVETVVIEELAPPPNELTEQRLDDMRDTTDRMVADRMAREKHRAELRQINAPADVQPVPQEVDAYYDTPTIYTGYPGYSGAYLYPTQPPWGNPNRPVHPIAKPPLLPPALHYSPDFDYPAKLIRKSYDPKVRAALR